MRYERPQGARREPTPSPFQGGKRSRTHGSKAKGQMVSMKFSGHETFPCRYSWLPKAYAALKADRSVFANEDGAMIALGVGKNMVRAIRFWAQAVGIAEPGEEGTYTITSFGHQVFGEDGFDPFLEDIRTLWLIHWRLSTNVDEPLFAWDYLLNRWQHPEITRQAVLRAFEHEAGRLARRLSKVTLEQHFDTFLHSYVPTRSRKGDIQEDNLDCPLVELELIRKVGERRGDYAGRREPIYAFSRDPKEEITPELFAYCIDDFWNRRRGAEQTLTFRDLSVAHGSPGQVFKLPESDIRDRLALLESDSHSAFRYRESVAIQQVVRGEECQRDYLSAIYVRNGTACDARC